MTRTRFYNAAINPLFYVSAVIFTVFCSVQFFFGQNFFGGNSTDLHYFFKAVPYAGIIVFPVLSISVHKEEFSPLKDYAVIFFQWLTVFLEYLAMLVPLFLVPVCVSFFGSVDWGQVFTGFLALILYGAGALSLCIFLNLIFSSGALAFILSCITLVITNVLHLIPLYSHSAVLDFLVKAFSFSWHFDAAGKGLLDSRDLVYFISVTFFFLILTFLVLQRKKGKKFIREQKIQIISIFIILIFANADSSRLYFRKDISSDRKYTVTASSKELFRNLEDSLNITYYRSSILTSLYPQVRDVTDYLQEYSSAKAVNFKVEDPDKTGTAALLENYGIYSRQVQTYGSNQTQFVNVYSAIVLEYLGRWEVIPFVLGADSLEYDLDGRLLHLISGKSRVVNILTGNGMSLDEDYSYLVPWLNNQGFICNEIKTDSNDSLEEQISADSKLLLVLGSSSLSEKNCRLIEKLLLNGVNALIFTSPYSAAIEDNWFIKKDGNQNLVNLLELYGFNFSENLGADLSCARITMESERNTDGTTLDSTYTQNINYPFWISLLPQQNAKQGITEFWPVSLSSENEDIKTLLVSSKGAWQVKPDKYSPENLFVTNPFQTQELLKEDRECETLALGLELDGKLYGAYENRFRENAQIVLVPDQYFVNSLMLGYTGGNYGDYRNLDFVVNQLLKLNGEEKLAELQEKAVYSVNTAMYKITDQIQFNEAERITLFLNLILVPFLFISTYVISIILRKKHIEALSNE